MKPKTKGDTRVMTERAWADGLAAWLDKLAPVRPAPITDIDLLTERVREEQDARALQYPY